MKCVALVYLVRATFLSVVIFFNQLTSSTRDQVHSLYEEMVALGVLSLFRSQHPVTLRLIQHLQESSYASARHTYACTAT